MEIVGLQIQPLLLHCLFVSVRNTELSYSWCGLGRFCSLPRGMHKRQGSHQVTSEVKTFKHILLEMYLLLTLALCSTLAFLSSSRLTTSVLPWKQARVSAVFLLVSIWAFISEPMSSNNFTAAVCPFMAANIKGEMPNLLPVLKEERKKTWINHISEMTWTKRVKTEYLTKTESLQSNYYWNNKRFLIAALDKYFHLKDNRYVAF